MTTTTPNNLKSEALLILAEIPHTFIALANAHNARPQMEHYLRSLRSVHREIAIVFGEPRPRNLGVPGICDDLARWVSVWTWHPHAERWVAQLRHILHVGDQVDTNTDTNTDESELRWVEKPDAVCPTCLTTGHLRYQESSWDHYCARTFTTWGWKEYRDAVKRAVAELQYRVSRDAA